MTVPQIRLSPSGPPIDLGALITGGLGTFARPYRRSGNNTLYTAEAATIGAPFTDYIQPAIIVPGTNARIGLPMPSAVVLAAVADDFAFAIESIITGTINVAGTGAATNTVVALQTQYRLADEATWEPLSETGSGTAFLTFPEDGNQNFALHAMRYKSTLAVAADADEVNIRVAWGIIGGEEGTEATMIGSAGDQEGATGGWDWSVAWCLRPQPDIET
jgi:hypothetical protein